jgi:hypothetical protein
MMLLQSWICGKLGKNSHATSIIDDHKQTREADLCENENLNDDEILVVYLANGSSHELIIDSIRSINNKDPQVSFYANHLVKTIL